MKTCFSKQGYRETAIKNDMKKVSFAESRSKTKAVTGMPFVVICYIRLKVLGKFIHEILKYLLRKDKVKDTSVLRSVVSSRTSQKLTS